MVFMTSYRSEFCLFCIIYGLINISIENYWAYKLPSKVINLFSVRKYEKNREMLEVLKVIKNIIGIKKVIEIVTIFK